MVEYDKFKPSTKEEVDDLLSKKEKKYRVAEDRIRIANEIKRNPPKPGFMKVDVKPGIYSIDLNIDAHWWFNHVCTVFPLLLDQGIRTHVDIKDSFKAKKRLPDFNYIWLVLLIVGLVGVFLFLSFTGMF